MTREVVAPAWAWVCDGCRHVDARLTRTQGRLPTAADMKAEGWQISDRCPVHDLCPDCGGGPMSIRSARGWRSGVLGRILHIHSPSAHILGQCWCQKRPPRAEQTGATR